MPSPLTIQPNATAGKDTYITSFAADSNYGASVYVSVGDTRIDADTSTRGLVAFDVSEIPVGAVVTAVTLSLWEEQAQFSSAVTKDYTFHRVLRNWSEAQATFNIYSTGNNWGTAGCGLDGVDAVATASATLTLDDTAAADFVSWSDSGLVADVQSWVDSTAVNYGWILKSTGELAGVAPRYGTAFVSSDGATAGQRPKLVVTYTETAATIGLRIRRLVG